MFRDFLTIVSGLLGVQRTRGITVALVAHAMHAAVD